MSKLRAKFKGRKQLEEDTQKFLEANFKKNIEGLADSISFNLKADGQTAEGVVDVELRVVDKNYELVDYLEHKVSEDKVDDTVCLNLAKLRQNLPDVKKLFSDKRFNVNVRVYSIFEKESEISAFHNFGTFDNLRLEVALHRGELSDLVLDYDLSGYDPLESDKDICTIILCTDGNYKLQTI